MCNRASKGQVKMTELSLCTIAKVFVGEKKIKLWMMLWVKMYQKTCTKSWTHESDALFRRGESIIALRLKEFTNSHDME